MNETYIRNVLEAAMLAAGKALTLAELGQLFDESARPKVEDVRAALDALAADYANRAIEVKETAAGFRIQVRREFSGEISRLWPERPARYSRALLETLALIAYRQPITRAEIEAVRGVAVNPNIVKTVIERNWVRVVGHRDVPGRPELLGTTREFLDYFGLRSLDELPPLAELKAVGDYNLQLELPNAGPLNVEGTLDGAAAGVADGAAAGDDAAAGVADSATAAADGAAVDGAAAVEGADAIAAESAPQEGVQPEGAASDETAPDVFVESAFVTDAAESEASHSTDDADSNADAIAATEEEPIAAHQIVDAISTIDGASDEPALVDDLASLDDVAIDAVASLDVLEVVREETSDSDESDIAGTTPVASHATDSVEDGAEEETDEDELSADGQGTRELVAGPRDQDE